MRLFQSTPPARGATSSAFSGWCSNDISIHAPREGGDLRSLQISNKQLNFNPRPPRGGRLLAVLRIGVVHRISIHAPREGGDLQVVQHGIVRLGISIHAPREGGDGGLLATPYTRTISIHAPREGGDRALAAHPRSLSLFQSTPPARGATRG